MHRLVIGIGLVMVVALVPVVWAEENNPEPTQQSGLRVEDLPKPIPELLDRIQALSRDIEPEITKLGSRLGQELKQAVKQLREEFQSKQRRKQE